MTAMSLFCPERIPATFDWAQPFVIPDELVRRARAEAERRGRRVILSFTWSTSRLDPIEVFCRATAWGGSHQLWIDPAGGAFVAIGSLEAFTARGAERFAGAEEWWSRFAADTISAAEPGVAPLGPRWVGGFSFDPEHRPVGPWSAFPPGQLVLPELIYALQDGEATFTRIVILDPEDDAGDGIFPLPYDIEDLQAGEVAFGEFRRPLRMPGRLRLVDPSADLWRESVRQVVRALGRGEAEKVVLARAVRAEAEEEISWGATLRRLQRRHPECFIFAVARDETCFLGATPELLVSVDGPWVESMALAGSAERSADPCRDTDLGEALRRNEKELREHGIVVRAIREALGPVCDSLQIPETPGVRKLSNVQHLYTPIRGRLQDDVSLLSLVERLHPTPAVGGYPGPVALEAIRRCEPSPRGWYAGVVGWMDAVGNGSFAVAIRSAVVSGTTAHLYAGCGIMSDSDVEQEFVESRLKLNALLEALGGASE